VAVRRVDGDDVRAGLEERLDARLAIGAHAHGRAAEEAPERVLRGVGVLLDLLDVLDGDEALQLEGVVHDEELLDAVPVEQHLRLVEGDADLGGDEILRHHLLDALLEVPLEAQVAVRDDADELAPLHHGDAADAVLAHEPERPVDGRVRLDGDGVGHHRRLVLLHLHHLGGLLLDGEVLVDEADAAGRRDGDGHARLGDRVHRRGDDGDVQREVAGQPSRGLDGLREYVGFGGEEQDVVERERQSQIVAIEHGDV
jgi:hypothetical protein